MFVPDVHQLRIGTKTGISAPNRSISFAMAEEFDNVRATGKRHVLAFSALADLVGNGNKLTGDSGGISMAFCPGCGTQVADGITFCPSCGKPVGASAGSGAAAAPAAAPVAAANSGLADNIAGLLCYSPIGVICSIIWLVAEPYKSNRFLRFHSFQALFLCAAFFVFGIVWGILGAIVGMIFAPLALVMFPIGLLIWLGALALCIFMMIKAYQMQTPHLPIIGALADKQV